MRALLASRTILNGVNVKLTGPVLGFFEVPGSVSSSTKTATSYTNTRPLGMCPR